MNMTNYFDLEEVLVNELIGDIWLFVFIGVIMIWLYSLKSKLPFQIPILLSIMWFAVCFSISTGTLLILWFMALLAVGGIFYYGISKLMR